jgi:hypothetical protein
MSGSRTTSTTKTQTIRTIADSNPDVDLDQVKAVGRLLEDLETVGIGRRTYEIASPYERYPMRDESRHLGAAREQRIDDQA